VLDGLREFLDDVSWEEWVACVASEVREEVRWKGGWVQVGVESVFGFENVVEQCGEFFKTTCGKV
jgi:hypothetical protein